MSLRTPWVSAAVVCVLSGSVTWLIARRLGLVGVRASKQRVKVQLLERMRIARVELPRGKVTSECHALPELSGTPVILPAVLGRKGKLLLGDYVHACALVGDVDDDTDPNLVPFLQRHGPCMAILNCMGGIDRGMQKVYDRASIPALGLSGALDKDHGDATFPNGYPMLANHLSEAHKFLCAQLAAGRTVFVHCHEGKNRSACLCVAHLLLAERMCLSEAVMHVFERRPVVLSNESFLDQLIDFAHIEGRLTSVTEDLSHLFHLLSHLPTSACRLIA